MSTNPYARKYPNTHNPYAERPPFHKYDTRHKRRAYGLNGHSDLRKHEDIEKQARLERKTARAAKKGKGGTRRRHRKHRHTRRR